MIRAINNQPFFSVVMPLYNKAKSVRRAVRSVLVQDFADFELIVVNDGSTDSGPDIVSEIHDPRLRLVSQANSGVSAARNAGVDLSRSCHIAFLDADDQWDTTYLSTIHRLVRRFPHAGIYSTAYTLVDGSGKWISAVNPGLLGGNDEGVLHNYFRAACSRVPPICTSSICIPKHVYRSVGGFPLETLCGEDIVLWAKIALAHEVVVTRQCGAVYHQVGTENNTRFRYFGSNAYFDYLSLLEGHSDFPYYGDLEKYVVFKTYETAMTALVHGDDCRAVRAMLRRTAGRDFRWKRTSLKGLLLLPHGARQILFQLKQRIKALGL
jgi:glycosyltransferase involved in cell wall biosynthesis